MTKNLYQESTPESTQRHLSKTQKFLENTKNAVKKVILSTGIVAQTMGPANTSSIPTTINTITATSSILPTTAKTAITLGTATALMNACCEKDNIINTVSSPIITTDHHEINIFGKAEINVHNNQLLLGNEIIASRKDNNIESCKITIKFNGQEIKPGDIINEEGILSLTITNQYGKSTTTEFHIINDLIYGTENLKGVSMKVDQEINLLNGVTFSNGVELIKTEIEIDGEMHEIEDPNHYIPQYPGICNITFTIKGNNNNTTEITVDNITIQPLDHKSITINNIKPVDILPTIGQIEAGDKKVYEHIEHLRIAEATRIRDMMRKYGAGNHNPEEYQQLMNRLNTGMLLENPEGYNNYESIGGDILAPASSHAQTERSILNTLINHANFKVVNPKNANRVNGLQNHLNENSYNINIFGCSAYATVDKKTYLEWIQDNSLKNLYKSKNFLVFIAGSNISTINSIPKNKIYHEDIDGDEHGIYGLPSSTNGKNDNIIDKHLIITIGTNAEGDIDQTNEIYESSKFPVGFHNDVLFAGRAFPRLTSSGKIVGETGKYPTSYVNYTNVAIADLCFQMFAEVKDVDQLLDMIRSSTDLRDHIRFDLNGDGDTDDICDNQPENQELILMNPAGFFKKYLMPDDLPSSIESSEISELKKGYYKGVIFDIPGTEVNIDGQWIAYNDENKSLIKSQNPFNLQWRLNGDLCRKLGYKGKFIEGKIIVVDDQWNGLNIDKNFSINIQ